MRPVAALRPRLPPPEKVEKGDRPIPISRPNFVEMCEEVVTELEASYLDLWSTVGLSVDWNQTYTTIGPKATRVSQRAFLRLVERDLAYRSGAPTLWDVDMRTAVAQAELKTGSSPAPTTSSCSPARRRRPAHRHDPPRAAARRASRSSPTPTTSATSRCSASTATTPLFGVEVPIVAHELAEPDKGTGIAMICTFGDTTDVTWWRELGLPVRPVVHHDGRFGRSRFGEDGWESVDADRGQRRPTTSWPARPSAGPEAHRGAPGRRRSAIDGDIRPITHPVKFWENGTKAARDRHRRTSGSSATRRRTR